MQSYDKMFPKMIINIAVIKFTASLVTMKLQAVYTFLTAKNTITYLHCTELSSFKYSYNVRA